jgi:hypothetical protein
MQTQGPQSIGTFRLQDGSHVQYDACFTDQVYIQQGDKLVKGPIRKVFMTPGGFIYGSGKPVLDRKDLEWIPEPARSKALAWYDNGMKFEEKKELTEIEKLKLRIAELEGKKMGEEDVKKVVTKNKPEPVKPVAPVVPVEKKKREWRCNICGVVFHSGLQLGKHRKDEHSAVQPSPGPNTLGTLPGESAVPV